MALIKIGENLTFSTNDILTPKQAFEDRDVARRFVKLAKKLKRLAPKANDFVYASTVMMHAAEAALIDQNTGDPIMNKKGEPVAGKFIAFKNEKGQDSVKWESPDEIMPYKNANGDVFSEEELLKAYKLWRGKPLCKDHQSDSIEGVRGIVIDTYYCPKFKRVHALFAVDKKNYGDLARKVETGYARAVSMGTAVGRSVCSDCGNVAKTERDYCKCIHAKSNYGEFNLDLNPIELSLVVNGADSLATIKEVIASMNVYVNEKQEHIDKLAAQRCVNPAELQNLSDSVNDMQAKLKGLMHIEKEAAMDADKIGQLTAAYRSLKEAGAEEAAAKVLQEIEALTAGETTESEEEHTWPPVRPGAGGPSVSPMNNEGYEARTTQQPLGIEPTQRLASKEGDAQGALQELSLLRSKIESMQKSLNALNKKENTMNSARLRARAKMRRAYWLGGGGVNEPTPGKPKYPKDEADKIRDNEDRQMTGEPLETGSDGLHPGDKEVKEKLLRAEDLQERAMKRRAYFQGGGGVNEPTPGKTKYPKEEADKIRDNEDKQMTGTYEMGGTDGMVPGDEPVKKQLLRAKLKARFTKVADAEGALRKDASRWEVFAGDDMILSATGDEIFGDQLDDNWDYLSSKQYGKDVISTIRSEGFDRVAYLLKGAQPPMADPAAAPEAAPADPMAAPPMDLAAPEADPPAEGEVDVEQPKDEAQSKVDAALNTIEEKIAEIREEVGGMGDELVDIDVNVSDKDEGGEAAAPAPMEEALAAREDLLAIEAMLDESADELALISEALEKSEDVSDDMLKATAQALEDSETLLSEAKKKMDKDDKKEDKKEDKEDKDDKKEDKEDKKEDKEDDDEKKEAQKLLDDALKLRAQNRADMLKRAMDKDLTAGDLKPETPVDKLDGDAADDDAAAAAEDDAKDGGCDHGEDCMDCADAAEDFVLESDESLKEARRRDREQLVAEAADKILGKYELDLGPAQNATEPKYFDAHPGGKGTVTELTHTKTDGAKVETISEVHDVMRDVAESGPRNVREAAMLIQEQIVKGAFKAEDLERLVAEGKVDSAAASYWKKYWAQGPDTGSFGADLSKEFSTKKKESSDNSYKVKIRRAYDLGIVAQEKGIIGSTRAALDKYVDEVMEFDDAAFESTKRIVANMADKSAGSMPRVGVEEVESKPMTVTASDEAPANTLAQLSSLGWK